MTRELIQEGIDLVKQCEGLYTTAYRCPAGVWTIGYGHTEGVRPKMTVSEQEAEDLLRRDLAEAGAEVERLVRVELNAFQFAALTSFVFNAGAASLAASTLLKRLNDGQYDAVPIELAKWVKATNPKTGQKITLTGLVRRRAMEGQLWLKTDGEDPFLASPQMVQKVHCDSTGPSFMVMARSGLRLREGAGLAHEVLRVIPYGTRVQVQREKNGWAAVDLEGDGVIDGWLALDLLAPIHEEFS